MIDLQLVPSLPQRQDSTADQMVDLVAVANRLGMYGAADAVRQLMENQELKNTIEAWQLLSVFQASQLSHTLARLESAKQGRDRINAIAGDLGRGVLALVDLARRCVKALETK